MDVPDRQLPERAWWAEKEVARLQKEVALLMGELATARQMIEVQERLAALLGEFSADGDATPDEA